MYWIEIAILSRLLVEVRREAPSVLELVEAHRPAGEAPAASQRLKTSVL
jgi:hypothetical protein